MSLQTLCGLLGGGGMYGGGGGAGLLEKEFPSVLCVKITVMRLEKQKKTLVHAKRLL